MLNSRAQREGALGGVVGDTDLRSRTETVWQIIGYSERSRGAEWFGRSLLGEVDGSAISHLAALNDRFLYV